MPRTASSGHPCTTQCTENSNVAGSSSADRTSAGEMRCGACGSVGIISKPSGVSLTSNPSSRMRSRSASAAAKSFAARRSRRSSASLWASSSLIDGGGVSAAEEHERAAVPLLGPKDLAQEDRVVTALEDVADSALQPGHHVLHDRHAGVGDTMRQAVELVVALPRERRGEVLVAAREDVHREQAARLDAPVGVRVAIDADEYERWLERDRRERVDREPAHAFGLVFRADDGHARREAGEHTPQGKRIDRHTRILGGVSVSPDVASTPDAPTSNTRRADGDP